MIFFQDLFKQLAIMLLLILLIMVCGYYAVADIYYQQQQITSLDLQQKERQKLLTVYKNMQDLINFSMNFTEIYNPLSKIELLKKIELEIAKHKQTNLKDIEFIKKTIKDFSASRSESQKEHAQSLQQQRLRIKIESTKPFALIEIINDFITKFDYPIELHFCNTAKVDIDKFYLQDCEFTFWFIAST